MSSIIQPVVSLDRQLPIKAACLACRSRHQKCDGGTPICGRCVREGKDCDYTPSKRGKVTSHLSKKRKWLDEPVEHDVFVPEQQANTLLAVAVLEGNDRPDNVKQLQTVTTQSSIIVTQQSNDQHMSTDRSLGLALFYEHFFPCHPFLPPYNLISEHLRRDEDGHLATIVEFIGLRYRSHLAKTSHLPALPVVYQANGFTVQTFLLHAIASHMSGDAPRGVKALAIAVDVALNIGLHQKSFVNDNGLGSAVLEEGWRRTWWELYVLDIQFAALNQQNRLLDGIDTEISLPCEEEDYNSGHLLRRQPSLHEFDNRVIEDTALMFSSFVYRIAAARAMLKVMQASMTTTQSGMRDAELALENHIMHMPRHMHTVLREHDGTMDEMRFQCHMMTHAATIFLHRPLSALNTFEQPTAITCTPSTFNYSETTIYHTKKCLDAADELSQLVNIGAPVTKRTPFFTCALALQSLVHLGGFSLPQWGGRKSMMSQQVQLSIGALAKLSDIWQTPAMIREQVLQVAKIVLQPALKNTSTDEKPTLDTAKIEERKTPMAFTIEGLESFEDDDAWFQMFLEPH